MDTPVLIIFIIAVVILVGLAIGAGMRSARTGRGIGGRSSGGESPDSESNP